MHPGEFIKAEIDARGWCQADLAYVLGVSAQAISRIVAGKTGISAAMTLALADAFDISPEYIGELQAAHDLSKARAADPAIERRAFFLRRYPIREMIERRWLNPTDDVAELEAQVMKFFCVDSLDQLPKKGSVMHLGDTFPAPLPRRGAQTGTIAPVWFAFTTPPQQESPARAWLAKQGVEAWFPTETAWRIMARGKNRKIEYQRRVAPGYIFARFTGQPQWDVLKASRHISGVIGHGDRPVVIPEAAIEAMAQVPSRIAERRAAAFLAAQINPGDRAEITSGAMVDWIVEVMEVNKGVARFMLGGATIDVDMARLVKRG